MNTIIIDGQEYTEYNLECPDCAAPMLLKKSKYGVFYGCQDYYFKGCPGSIGAQKDGTPLGIPTDNRTKYARVLAQENFTRLWCSGKMTRQEAFSWLCKKMKISRRDGNISKFNKEQCYNLVAAVNKVLKGHRYTYV